MFCLPPDQHPCHALCPAFTCLFPACSPVWSSSPLLCRLHACCHPVYLWGCVVFFCDRAVSHTCTSISVLSSFSSWPNLWVRARHVPCVHLHISDIICSITHHTHTWTVFCTDAFSSAYTWKALSCCPLFGLLCLHSLRHTRRSHNVSPSFTLIFVCPFRACLVHVFF